MSLTVFIVACISLLVLAVGSLTLVPWVGHVVVKILTLGKVDLGWGPSDSESEVTLRIGFFVLLVIAGVTAAVVHN
jgi:hypothetical protein